MKLVKNNQKGRSLLTNSFFIKMVQMRRCFQATCTKPVHEEKNIQKMCRFNKESGRSMVEMLGVLAIIGVLSVGAIAGYSKAMEELPTLAFDDQCTGSNPRYPLIEEIEKLYWFAYEGNYNFNI